VLAGLLVSLTLAAAFGWAEAAGGAPPGGPPPADPPPPPHASCTQTEPHPTLCARFEVTCPSDPKVTLNCTTKSPIGPRTTIQRLLLHLPRGYVSLKLTCRADRERGIACRIASFQTRKAAGLRTIVLRIPQSFDVLRIMCRTSLRGAFGCRL
jgi:hypothetical protein